MMANVLLDVAVGTIPIVGDLFDVGFKANTRNVKLLEPYGHPGQGRGYGPRWRAGDSRPPIVPSAELPGA